MQPPTVAIIAQTGAEGDFPVDLPLDAATLNERLMEIGIWLVQRQIPHRARVLFQPGHNRLRIRFPRADDARAFRGHFGRRSH